MTDIYSQSLQYQYPTGVDPNDPSTWYSYDPFGGERTSRVNFDSSGLLDTQSYLKNINNLLPDKAGYTTYVIPSANTGIDNKSDLINFANQYGINADGSKVTDATFGSMVYVPNDYMQSAPKAIDYNPSVDKDWGPTLGALFLGGVGLASGGLGSLFSGAGEAGAAGGSAAFDAAAGLGGATSAGAGSVGAATSSGLGSLGTAASTLGSSAMDWSSLFGDYNFTPDAFYGPTASGIPLDAAMGMAGPTQSGWTLADALMNESTAGALSGSTSSSIFDLVKQYGQPAAKALGLTTANGDIDWGRIIKGAGETALGMYGANQSADAMERISDKYMNLGAPYRQKLSDLYANPDSFLTSKEVTTPVDQGTNALARALSVKGNPTGSGTALQEMQNYSSNMLFGKLGEEKTRLGALGGLTSMPASVGMGADMSAAQNTGSGLNALGYGLNSMLNPQPSSIDLYKQFTNSLK